MLGKQKEVLYNAEVSLFWEFLMNYQWGTLIKGRIVSEEKHKWFVQLENGRSKNIQIVEMTFDDCLHKLEIKITPKFNKHKSYDLITISLLERGKKTKLSMNYSYYPKSLSEWIFAVILNHEDNLFDEYAKTLFNDINKDLLKEIYG